MWKNPHLSGNCFITVWLKITWSKLDVNIISRQSNHSYYPWWVLVIVFPTPDHVFMLFRKDDLLKIGKKSTQLLTANNRSGEIFEVGSSWSQQASTCSKLTLETLEQGVNMFKVNKKDARRTSCSRVSIVNFGYVIAS